MIILGFTISEKYLFPPPLKKNQIHGILYNKMIFYFKSYNTERGTQLVPMRNHAHARETLLHVEVEGIRSHNKMKLCGFFKK